MAIQKTQLNLSIMKSPQQTQTISQRKLFKGLLNRK